MSPNAVVAVVGTPGVGKTTLCTFFSKRYGCRHVRVDELALDKKLYTGYDKERGVPIANIRALRREVKRSMEVVDFDLLLLDGHYAHELVPAPTALGVFVMRMEPLELYRRSLKRYTERKARENSMSEFLGVISFEARRLHDRVVDVDVTKLSLKETVAKLRAHIARRFSSSTPAIDWTESMSEKRIRRFLKLVEDEVLLS